MTVLGERWPESLILLPSDLDDVKGVDLQVEAAPLVQHGFNGAVTKAECVG
jgi:hypothetical protein